MTHRRKKFLVYPPNYQPGDGYVIKYSKRQAWKVAVLFGAGASVDASIHIHPRQDSIGKPLLASRFG
jgi:hypothetical protein